MSYSLTNYYHNKRYYERKRQKKLCVVCGRRTYKNRVRCHACSKRKYNNHKKQQNYKNNKSSFIS